MGRPDLIKTEEEFLRHWREVIAVVVYYRRRFFGSYEPAISDDELCAWAIEGGDARQEMVERMILRRLSDAETLWDWSQQGPR